MIFQKIAELVSWLITLLYFVCVICFLGVLIGAITHLLFALLFVKNADIVYYASLGCIHGVKYSSLWAGGIAIVLCFMRGHKNFSTKKVSGSGVHEK